MKDNLDSFLKDSPLAGRIKLSGKIVVQRTKLSPRAIAAIRQQGTYTIDEPETCELVFGNRVIARGKIIQKDGESFFQPLKTDKEA